jgi:hypothetical protein
MQTVRSGATATRGILWVGPPQTLIHPGGGRMGDSSRDGQTIHPFFRGPQSDRGSLQQPRAAACPFLSAVPESAKGRGQLFQSRQGRRRIAGRRKHPDKGTTPHTPQPRRGVGPKIQTERARARGPPKSRRVLRISPFRALNLFRISNFELSAFSIRVHWRPFAVEPLSPEDSNRE